VGNKKYITFYFLVLTFYLFGCAPRIAPPPLYKDLELSLEEVISIVSKDIKVLKAVVGMNIERDNKSYSYVDASVLIKRPNLVHIRTYRFGILVGDYLIKDNAVYVLSGKGSELKEFGEEFFYSIFWWDNIRDGLMYREEAEYIIKAENREIHLDRATLLPLRQRIQVGNKDISIVYSEPEREEDFWYPSVIRIDINAYRFIIDVKKLIINPPLSENDFKIL
jgi:hypothetical protein